MTKRMTEAAWDRGIKERAGSDARLAAFCAREADRARAEEERLTKDLQEKDSQIRALADLLARHGYACRVANPADPCFCLGCETRAALRLAGRLP